MENIVSSISLSKDIDVKIKKLAQNRGQTKNAIMQQALRDFVMQQEIWEIEKKMQAKARAMGIENDDDVVELIHHVRRKGK